VGCELAETIHCINGTKKDFRLVVNREVGQGEPFGEKGPHIFAMERR